jgi:hypothetical protein
VFKTIFDRWNNVYVLLLVIRMLRIVGIQVEEFSIALVEDSPLVVATGGFTRVFPERRGAYIKLACLNETNGKTLHATGELVEPVFCVSNQTQPYDVLRSGICFLRSYLPILNTHAINVSHWRIELDSLLDRLQANSGESDQASTIACFAVEQALLVTIAKTTERPLDLILREWVFGNVDGYTKRDTVRINSMFNARLDRAVSVAPGCTKIKVGSSDPKSDADLVNSLCNNYQGTEKAYRIRLDANKMWTVDQAGEFFNSLSDDAIDTIEYIEEPVNCGSIVELTHSIRDLHARHPRSTRVPIALDESLMIPETAEFLTQTKSLRIIHKTYLHGIRAHRRLLFGNPERVTITCTFETGVGLSFLCCLAAAINSSAYHGIHALSSMKICDESTEKFSAFMRSADEGIYVSLADVFELL